MIAVKGNEYRSIATPKVYRGRRADPGSARGALPTPDPAPAVRPNQPIGSLAALSRRQASLAPELSLHHRGDLIPREVIETVVVGPHPLGEVGAGIDRIGLVHRGDSGQVLNRGQVREVTR